MMNPITAATTNSTPNHCDYDEVPDPPFDYDAPHDDSEMYPPDGEYDPSSDF